MTATAVKTRVPLLRTDRLNAWHGVGAAIMALIGVLVTREAWLDIYQIAMHQEEYSHIFLVPVVVAWLVWVRRMRFRHCDVSFTLIGPLTVAIGWAISAFGFYNGVQSFWHGGALVVVIGCVLSITGKNALVRFLPAFAVLIFLIPVPDRLRQEIAIPLQRWTASITQSCFELVGIESELKGMAVLINGKTPQVAEACNGMRMVFALIMVVFAFAYGMPIRNSVRLVLLAGSPLAALVCNVIRVVPTIWLYGNASEMVAETFHDWAGWAMLPIAFLMLYGILKILKWAMIPVIHYPLASQ